jgi:tripartite-type tricarboxylate transporter receptor subunit TctC
MRRRDFISLVGGAAIFTGALRVAAQDYPARPIALVVPFPAGGGNDAVARVIAEKMSRTLGQQIVVENRGGAGGTIATRAVARDRPGFSAPIRYGLVAPAGTLAAIVEQLSHELRAAVMSEEVREQLLNEGAQPVASTPAEYAAEIDSEELKWSALVKSLNLKME